LQLKDFKTVLKKLFLNLIILALCEEKKLFPEDFLEYLTDILKAFLDTFLNFPKKLIFLRFLLQFFLTNLKAFLKESFGFQRWVTIAISETDRFSFKFILFFLDFPETSVTQITRANNKNVMYLNCFILFK